MKRILIALLLVVVLILSAGCSTTTDYISAYKITTPLFPEPKSLYAKEYIIDDNTLVITEWWVDDGAISFNPRHHTGTLRILEPYSIESIGISDLPDN